MPKSAFLLLIPLFSTNVSIAQARFGFGYTAGSINGNGGVAGGLSFAPGYNVVEWENASLSVSTNWKIGFQDKIASALIIPLAVAAADPSPPAVGTDGGTIHVFTELPLLIHYNFGFGSTSKASLRTKFGFFLGGGISALATGYADTAGYSRAASFSGYVFDGGVRVNGKTELSFASVFSFQGPIGQVRRPAFFEMTISTVFPK